MSRRRRIHRLSPETVEKIAAGEVVERPASVVKELVENAIDAEATEVVVRLESGGLDLIEVTDDGGGIPEAELGLAIESHTTSKIDAVDDLTTLRSLGFRGEALAAIGAVAHLRLISRTPESDVAHGVSVVGGRTAGTFLAGRPVGTTAEVRDLFFNTPARRKFLKTPAAEQVAIVAALERTHLASPGVGLTLFAEGAEVARWPGTRELPEAAAQVLGAEFIRESLPVAREFEGGGYVAGVIGRPSLARGGSSGFYLSVDGRPVDSKSLAQAVRLAYQDYLPRGRFPVGIIQLQLGGSRVDVNVHPTKREVRFTREREISDGVRQAVRAALLEMKGPSSAPLSRAEAFTSEPGIPAEATLPSLDVVASTDYETSLMARTPVQTRLSLPETPATLPGTSRRPSLRLLGPLFRMYWVAESPQGVVLIDQHAASERVLYDLLRSTGRIGAQTLLTPVVVKLTAGQEALLKEQGGLIAHAGFDLQSFGKGRYRLLSVPFYRGLRARPEALRELLDELRDGGRATIPNGLEERRAASVACHAAIRGGDTVSVEEMRRVLEALGELGGPSYACPHGRPILVQLPRSRLDRWFLRSGA